MNIKKYNQEQIDEAMSIEISFEFFKEYGRFPRDHGEQLMFFIDRHAAEYAQKHQE